MSHEMKLIDQALAVRAAHFLPADLATTYLVATIIGFELATPALTAEALGLVVTDMDARQVLIATRTMKNHFARNGEHMAVKILPALDGTSTTPEIDLGEFNGDKQSDSYRLLETLAARYGRKTPLLPPEGKTRHRAGDTPELN